MSPVLFAADMQIVIYKAHTHVHLQTSPAFQRSLLWQMSAFLLNALLQILVIAHY